MQKKKGEYGYRESKRKMRLFLVLLLLAAILIQLFARYLTDSQAAKNILTVMAVLTVLPMANMASPLIASWKYRTAPAQFHEKTATYETSFTILYDLIITSKEFILPMDAIAVHPNGVVAFCSSRKVDSAKAEQFLNNMLAGQKLDANAKVVKDEKTFFRRLDNLKPSSEYEDDGSLPYVEALLKSLSM